MRLPRHSSIAHAAYHDLLRSLRDDAVLELRGTPTRLERGGRAYWYDSYRVGSTVRQAYIGEDDAEIRVRLERIKELRASQADRLAGRSRLIRILRAEGFLSIDGGFGSLMAALAKAGLFRLGETLVGTIAFRFYEGELGLRYGFDDMAQTNDIDIASFERLSLALEDAASEPVQKLLSEFAFAPVPTLERDAVWRWRQTRSETLIAFLTPSFEEDEVPKKLPTLGVHAQSMHFLNFLIAEPIKAAVPYRSGVLVQIPRPERFAIHKLIIADRRRDGPDSLKSHKDRRQASFLIEALAEDRPEDLREAYENALSRGPRWRDRLSATLKRMPETAKRLEGL